MAAFVFFTISAINAAGIPLSWNAPLPGITLSLVQIFLLVALLIAVFWISSRTKRFLFNRFLVDSGLDRSLQYAIAQIVSNLVLVIGVFIVLENTGIHLGALTVFAGAVGVGVGFGLQNITSNFISGLVILAERPITIGDRVEVGGIVGQVQQIRARSTVVVTNDNIATIVPNTKFIDSPVTNWNLWRSTSALSHPRRRGLRKQCGKSNRSVDRGGRGESAHVKGSGAECFL